MLNEFKTSIAQNIFYQKYALTQADTWKERTRSIVDDVCGNMNGRRRRTLSKTECEYLDEIITDMKFMPGGRYIYYAGRRAHYYNNCFEGSETFITSDGIINFKDNLGKKVNVYSHKDNDFHHAVINSYGNQKCYKIDFCNLRGNQQTIKSVIATKDHRWELNNGKITNNLSIGDVVNAANIDIDIDKKAWLHGFIFGDGNVHLLKNSFGHQLRLCGKKSLYLDFIEDIVDSVKYPSFADGDPVVYIKSKHNLKKLPTELSSEFDIKYISSFIKGWISADGHIGVSNKIHTINEKALDFFMKYAVYAGLVITGKKCINTKPSNFGIRKPLFYTSFQYSNNFKGFKVKSINFMEEREVYCVSEPETTFFTLSGGLVTGNCFLLKAEYDTREEWASLSQRAISCLMVGGGIGIDYSIIRPKGRIIHKTGGLSSGVLSLMNMINENGRNVMQGGSRRSAIYASLNWQHGDIHNFIKSKNWDLLKVGSTGLSVADLKHQDFNYNAPLDMTNISVNYDDLFLEEIKAGNLPSTFMKNIRGALQHGEPGFSFNFGDKQNETLRNAPVSKDTYVLLDYGYEQIKNIIDKKVIIWTGKQYTDTTFRKTKENADIIKVGMTGGREIKAEHSHEFFVEKTWKEGKINCSEIIKTQTKDLKINDKLVFKSPNIIDDVNDKDYILGYAYGDGSFNKYGGEITFCTDESKKCYNEMDKSIFSYVNENDSRGYIRAYFKKNFASSENHSKLIFPQNKIFSPSFVAGLFDADGSYDNHRDGLRLSSIHYSFLEDVRRSLDCMGIISTITTAGHTSFSNRQCYSISILQEYVKKFKDIIPTVRLKPEGRIPYRKSYIRVRSLEVSIPEDVYCCDVGVDEHSFMAEGIIISNCSEVTSEDDSDVCNLGSINMGEIEDINEFRDIINVASKFLVCGTLRADLPYEKVSIVREKNRRLGLGLMGIHEWLLKRNYKYAMNDELREWLEVYKEESEKSANEHCDRLYLNRPAGYRAIAPTGTIGLLASTTTGIEPLYSVAYKRRYLVNGTEWRYEYVIDNTAKHLIEEVGVNPDNIETAVDLAKDPERRIKFQADIQDYIDHAISSTINLPSWGSDDNNEDTVVQFSKLLSKYAPRLRGFTCYPDGSRGGQPIISVPYSEAKDNEGTVYTEHDICEISGKGGTCGS